jgi:hypothetical protein
LSPAFDHEQIIFAAALTMLGGLGCAVWSSDEYATRFGDSHHEPPVLRERFVVYDKLPPIVRAMIPGVAPQLIAELLSCFHVLARRRPQRTKGSHRRQSTLPGRKSRAVPEAEGRHHRLR